MASDLSAFHRVDDLDDLTGPAFFKLAYRLPHYRGVMRSIASAAASEDEGGQQPVALQSRAAPAPAAVPVATKASVAADPLMSQWISFA